MTESAIDEAATGAVLCVGMLTIDLVHLVERVPRPNEKVAELDQSLDLGGPATNAALTAAALGAPVHLAAGFGRSPLRPFVLDSFAQAGVQWYDPAAEEPSASPLSTILLTRGTGDRAVVGGAAPPLPHGVSLPPQLVETAAAVLLDGHAMPLAQETADRARSAGVPVVLDGGSYKPGTEDLLPHVDLAIFSADFSPPDHSDPLSWARAHGCRLAARSDGPRPLAIVDDRGRRRLVVPDVDIADTLGAGDVLHGAAAYAVARRGLDDVVPVLRFAVAVASLSCRYPGALGWARDPQARAVTHRLSTALVPRPVDGPQPDGSAHP